MNQKAPVMFISHGAPSFALNPGKAGHLLQRAGENFAQVKAVIVLSPHWPTADQEIMANQLPSTMHDYGGFTERLYRLNYPAPGSAELALHIDQQLSQHNIQARLNTERGRDHGAWVPLLYLLPAATIPVVQLSFRVGISSAEMIDLGRALTSLREQGIAIIGSGSLTHNLAHMGQATARPFEYAVEFQSIVREHLLKKSYNLLADNIHLTTSFHDAHPTDEHFLPLFFAIGALSESDQLEVLEGGILYGSLSMESYLWC